jgi:hypothetical protein
VDKLWTTSEIRNKLNLMRAVPVEEATVPKSILVEAESPHDSATMFSLRIDDLIVGRGLTAAQAHLLVGEILERVVLPQKGRPARNRETDELTAQASGLGARAK